MKNPSSENPKKLVAPSLLSNSKSLKSFKPPSKSSSIESEKISPPKVLLQDEHHMEEDDDEIECLEDKSDDI